MNTKQSQIIQNIKNSKNQQQSLASFQACAPFVDATLAYFEGNVPLQQVLAAGEKLQEQTEVIPPLKRQTIAQQLQFVRNHQPNGLRDWDARKAVDERLCNVLDLIMHLPEKRTD